MWEDIGYYESAKAEVLRVAGIATATEDEAEEMIKGWGYEGFKILPIGQKVEYIGGWDEEEEEE